MFIIHSVKKYSITFLLRSNDEYLMTKINENNLNREILKFVLYIFL